MNTTFQRMAIPLILTLVIVACERKEQISVNDLPEIKSAPAFEGTNYDGSTISSRDLAGKVYIAEFFFTSCAGPCPVMNSTANVLQAEFSDLPDFRIVAFTVDPETDQVPRLAKYAERYGAKKDRWYFLRNDIEVIRDIAQKGFMMGGDLHEPALHSTRFVLVDRDGMIRGYYDALDPAKVDELRAAIRFLAKGNA